MVNFVMGNFERYRATVRLYIAEQQVNAGDIVETDGTTIRFAGVELENPGIRSAINTSHWLVPESDATTVYVPVSAITKKLTTVVGEDNSVKTSLKSSVKKTAKTNTPVEDSSEGVVVARISSPAKKEFEITAQNVSLLQQEKERLERKGLDRAKAVERVVPPGGSTVTKTASHQTETDEAFSSLSEEDQAVLLAHRQKKAEAAKKAAEAAFAAELAEAKTAMGRTVTRDPDDGSQGSVVGSVRQAHQINSSPAEEELDARVSLIRQTIPQFRWDMAIVESERVERAVTKYGRDPLYLGGILQVETPSAKEAIQKRLLRNSVQRE